MKSKSMTMKWMSLGISKDGLCKCKIVYAFIIAILGLSSFTATAAVEPIASGSFIVNMGITPQTVGNGLKPYGLVYDLIKNYNVPVKWVINPAKAKDGIDFSHNGIDYKGSAFIVPAQFRTAAVNARITFWQGQGVIGATSISAITVPVFQTMDFVPRWTLDMKNGAIAEKFLIAAGIPSTAYDWQDPQLLSACNDLFVMPHADPVWATHSNLLSWNLTYKGSIWAGCHAVSALELMFNPGSTTQQTNFLSNKTGTALGAGPYASPDNSLIKWTSHSAGSKPYSNTFPAEPVMQFMSITDAAHTNGSEQVYLPVLAGSWRASTKIGVWDPTQANVPANSPGLAAIIAFGQAFGDPLRGKILYEAGHNIGGTDTAQVAAQRAFFNWSYWASRDKAVQLSLVYPPTYMNGGNPYPVSATVTSIPSGPYTYQWTSSCGGTFGNPAAASTTFTPPGVMVNTACMITIKVTDACGRAAFHSEQDTIRPGPRPPVAVIDSVNIDPGCGSGMITYNVLANDSDPDGDPISLTNVTGAINGTVMFNANGNIKYTSNSGFFGLETLTYTVCDTTTPVPLCANGTFKITVGNPALIPLAVNDMYTINEDSLPRFNVLLNDGVSLSVIGVPTLPLHGHVSINLNNSITYLPDADFAGMDSFVYKVQNAAGYTNTAKVKITVVDDACGPNTYFVGPAIPAMVVADTIDASADTYLEGNNINTNFGSSNDLQIDKNTGNHRRAIVKWSVSSIPMGAVIDSVKVRMFKVDNENNTVSIYQLIDNWTELGATWRDSISPNNWSVANDDNTETGPYINTALATLSAANNNVNTQRYETWNSTAALISLVTNWRSGVTANDGLIFTAPPSAGGANQTWRSRTNPANTPPQLLVYYTIPAVPLQCAALPVRAPMAMPDTAITQNGILVNIPTAPNDYYPVAGTKNYFIISPPVTGTAMINLTTGIIAYTPATSFNGIRTMTYRVLDIGSGLADTATVYVTITNGPVTAVDDNPPAMNSGVIQNINVKANDIDPEMATLTVTVIDPPQNGSTAVDMSGNVVYTPFAGFYGKDTLSYSICEPTPLCGTASCDTAFVFITVNNQPPNAVNDTVTVNNCIPVKLFPLTNDSDPEGGPLRITQVFMVMNGIATISADSTCVVFQPNNGFSGIATYQYVVCDNGNLCDTATDFINVAGPGVNTPPNAVEDFPPSVNANQTAFIDVLSNDSDPNGSSLTINLLAQPMLSPAGSGTISLAGQLIQFVPTPGFVGTVTFKYSVCDTAPAAAAGCPILMSACDTALVTLMVINAPPVAQNDKDTTSANLPIMINILINDFDPDGLPLDSANVMTGKTFNLAMMGMSVNGGSIVISPNGLATYTPPLNFQGIDTFYYKVCDTFSGVNKGCDTALVCILIQPCINPSAGPDQLGVCPASTVILAGINPTSGTWAQQGSNPAGGNLTNLMNGTASVYFGGTASGNYKFIYSISLGSCTDTMTVEVIDTVRPMINCPRDTTINCGTDTTPSTLGNPIVSDNCPGNIIISHADTINPGNCPNNFVIKRTWKAADSSGNFRVCVQMITVQDTTKPVITCPAAKTIDCEASQLPANTGTATATDNCGAVKSITLADMKVAGNCPGNYTINRTWTATDSCNNISTCLQVITVQDTTKPVITCPAAKTIDCEASQLPANTGTATATDNCGAVKSITSADMKVAGTCPGNYTIQRTWTATDSCNNVSMCLQVITVQDTTKPVITCPAAKTIDCEASQLPANTGTATATDNCGAVKSITSADMKVAGTCPGNYTIQRTWTATDSCNNISTCLQVITVQDTTKPVITCPAAKTIDCEASQLPGNTGTATATDNCGAVKSITSADMKVAGNCPGNYTINRTWTATDSCNNISTCLQIITVQDTTKPVITCPAAKTIDCEASQLPGNTGTATATDNCGAVKSITSADMKVAGNCPGNYTIQRTWTVTDSCNNVSMCLQIITLQDTTKPVITCPAAKTIDCEASQLPANTGTATATDNCGAVKSITSADMKVAGTCPGNYTIQRTWTATDSCNNISTCLQVITVQDTTKPVITCPAAKTIDCEASQLPANTGTATATDNCGAVKSITSADMKVAGTCPGNYTIQRTWTATDSCNNISMCLQVITVQDTTKPMITCPGPITVYSDASCKADTTTSKTGKATATDNCGAVSSITYLDMAVPGSCPGSFNLNRTWTAIDSCNNATSCLQVITVLDTTDPHVIPGTCPRDTTINCYVLITTPDALGRPKYLDNCTDSVTLDASFTYKDDSTGFDNTFPNGNIGTIKRTFYITDLCGNADSSCMQIITVAPKPPVAEVDHNATFINKPVNGDVSTNDKDLQGLPLTFNTTPVQNPANGMVTLAAIGQYTYTPNMGFTGIDSFRYSVCNALGLCDTTWVYIDVLPVTLGNDAPLALNDYFMSLVDVPVPGTAANNDIDPDWDPLTYTTTPLVAPVNGMVSLNSDGTFLYTPNMGFTGIDSFEYRVCDDGIPVLCDTAWVFIEIAPDRNGPANDPPVAGNDVNATPVNIAVSGSVAPNDFDPNGDPLTFTVAGPTPPGLVFNPDGTYTYTPPMNFTGTVSQVYSVCDNGMPNLCDTATLVIAVVPEPPIAEVDHNVTFINMSVNGDVSTNDKDPQSLPLTFNTTPVQNPANGMVTLAANGQYTYTPNMGFTGIDSFRYSVCNPLGLCDTTWVYIDVLPVTAGNDAPLALNDYFMSLVDVPVPGTAANNDIDPDWDPLTYTTTPLVAPVNGIVSLNSDGTFLYTPNMGFTGIDSFEYRVCDDGIPVLCDTAWVFIEIAPDRNGPGNDPPVAGNDVNATPVNIPVSGSVAPNDFDPNGDPLTFTVAGPTPPGLVFNPDGTYTYTPPLNFTGTVSQVYSVCDNGMPNLCDTATLVIAVVPEPPIAEVDHNATIINTPVNGDVSTNDKDPQGLPLTFNTTPVINPANGMVTLAVNGLYTYIPNNGFTGIDSFRYAVCNSLGLCDTTWAYITVLPVKAGNDAPLAMNDYFMTLVNVPVPGTTANNDIDPDWDPLTYTTTPLVLPVNGMVALNADGTFLYTPNMGFTGVDSFEYRVCDNGGPALCDTAWVYIEIAPDRNGPANDPPVAGNDVNATLANVPVSGSVAPNDFDPNGDPLIFTVAGPTPPGLVFNPDGSYTYTPPTNFTGTVSQVYSVCDIPPGCLNCLLPIGLCDTATLVIVVIPGFPTAEVDHNGTLINTPVNGDLSTNDYDENGYALIYNTTPDIAPPNGSVVINPDGTYTYTPNNGFTGVDSFRYVVCNTLGLCDTSWAFIAVMPITEGNDPPAALNDYFMTFINTPVTSTVANNDIDPESDPLTFNTVPIIPPANGILVLNSDGSFTYTPNMGFTGVDSFQYRVCDNGMPPLCDQAWAFIEIPNDGPDEVNNPPFAGNDVYLTQMNTPVSGSVLPNDWDPDGDPLVVKPVGPLPPGLILNMDGTFTYNPPTGEVGTINVPYYVCDDGNPALCDTATLTIIINYTLTCKDGLVCNNKVTISIDCEKKVTPLDLLKNQTLPTFYYEVVIKDAAGKIVPNATFTRADLGYCFTVSINLPYCNNSCWGTVCVEDKAPPKLDCKPDTILCFELGQLPTNFTVNDNCSGPAKVQIVSEQYIDYGCDSQNIQGVVKRHLIASDIWGNTAECEKLYYIKKVKLSDIICPRDTSIDCSLATVSGVHFGDPKRSGAPRIGAISLYPNNPSCKLTVSKKDDTLAICGGGFKILRTWTIGDWCTGKDTICKQTIAIEDKTAPIASDTTYATKQADPHDCRTSFDLKELRYIDCSQVTQTYSYPYLDEATGAIRIANGKLPATVWVGNGRTEVTVSLTDGCNHITLRKIILNVYDNTPPTPVCKEFTQVTVDPATCWAEISAKDLDNGSHDNCIGQLHFAVALMSDIEKARADYSKRIIDSCGSTEYWANKAWYDATIERWINCYVFDDKVTLGDCGSNQVVMRVYEADSMPRLDPHLWTCGEHAWFCYNTYQEYRTVHNYYNFRGTPAAKDCKAKGPWLCKSAHASWYSSRMGEFGGSFYIGANKAPGAFPQTHLYNECMVQVLVDDKQAPVVAGLEDIVVYCDNAPTGSAYARSFCENSEVYSVWPGTILDTRGKVHGYYGGSDYITNHLGGDHAPSVGCPNGSQWAPIYCKKWLLLDSFDNPGKIDAKSYFDKLVLFDKNRPGRTLLSSEFSITDNCKLDDASLKVTDAGSINGCGEGWIQRTWMMTDKCGNPVTAVQKVIVKHRSDFEVLFPMDKEVTCESNDATDTSHTGKPTIWDDECEQVGVRYEDEISTVTDGACYKIIRTWTLIDWCIYDANAHTIHPDVIVDDRLRAVTDSSSDRSCIMRNLKDNGDGYMKYIQIIKVTDHQAPVLSCRDTTINITANCDVNLYIPLQGTDNCAEKILYRVEITRPDGSKETRIDVQSISGTGFTSGVYSVKVTGRDNCGNEAECTMKITLVDKKAPTPYCLNGVATVIMPSTGSLEIWARDLDRASEDNCTPKDKLKFSFTKDVSTASRTMTCKDIIDGKEQAIELEIWVTDLSGNQDFCRTYVLLQDNGGLPGGVCKDTTIAFANITGKLYTENQEGVEFAEVQVKGLGSAGIPAFKTKSDGGYSFGSLPMNGISSIKALRDDNPMNGVSTLDLVLIQKHILGTESLKSPYRMIAADVNNSNDISVVDLLELRKLILGIYDKLPDNTSWKFVPKSYTFSDLANPWGYPTEDQITNMKDNMVRDFVGVKIGDVNSSAVSHSLMGTEIRSTETGLIFEVEDQVFKAGEQVKVEFRSPNFAGISGFQGTINFAIDNLRFDNLGAVPAIEKSSIVNSKINFTDNNIGKRWLPDGMITMSWNSDKSIDIDAKSTLFTMTFTASKAGILSEVMRIGSQHTIAESYEGKGELGNLSIRFVKNGKEIAGTNTLYQNYPNPFDQRTVIGIHLAQSIEGKLKITDVTGRLLKSIGRDWNKGYNEVWINRNEIGATGVLYYSFESKTFNAVKKMIILE